MHEIGVNYDHYLVIVKGNQGHPGRAARIRARRDREDLRPRVRFRGFAQVRVGNPLEITPIRKRETELNPRRGSARLRANRFAPLQTVDRPKPGKLRDQDGWQAGCARKRVLPSRFLIGLSRASDETRRKGLLNPSDPQLLRGRVARRGRLARRPPRRRPSELAPLGPFDPSAGLECGQRRTARQEGPEEVLHGQDEDAVAQEALLPAVEQDRYPFAVNENPPSQMADLLRFRQLEWRISGRGSRKGASPGEGAGAASAAPAPVGVRSARPFVPSATGARPFVLLSFRPVVLAPRKGAAFPGARPRTTGRRDDRIAPARLRDEGDAFSSSRQLVVSSFSRRGRGRLSPQHGLRGLPCSASTPFPHAQFAKSQRNCCRSVPKVSRFRIWMHDGCRATDSDHRQTRRNNENQHTVHKPVQTVLPHSKRIRVPSGFRLALR